jgi:hypothetical protein
MRRKYVIAAIVLSLISFAACKKSNTGGDGTTPSILAGNWNLVSVGVNVTNTFISQYTTTNNTGLITFSADSMLGKGVGYTANFTGKGYEYEDGALLDSLTEPFTFTYPPTNSSAAYGLIGNDSLTFPAGGLVTLPGSAAGQQTVPVGGRFVISGTAMTITIHFSQSSMQQSAGGATSTTVVQGVEVVNLQKE